MKHPTTPKPTRNVALKELSGLLREELEPRLEGDTLVLRHLYALVDMARMEVESELRLEAEKKLRKVCSADLLIEPRYKKVRQGRRNLLIVSALNRDNAAFLEEWGTCNGDLVSAWIVSALPPNAMVQHLRQTTHLYDTDKELRLMRFYDPLGTPILHRLADRKWVEWLFGPLDAWWYPVASPQEETWSRIEGGGQSTSGEAVPLYLSEELSEALKGDPLPYHVLDLAEQACPAAFASECYGVRLAKVEEMLEAGRKQKLSTDDDLTLYVLTLLEEPQLAQSPHWQEAIQRAAAGKATLEGQLRRIKRTVQNVE